MEEAGLSPFRKNGDRKNGDRKNYRRLNSKSIFYFYDLAFVI